MRAFYWNGRAVYSFTASVSRNGVISMGTPSRNERLARITERGRNKIGSNNRAATIPPSNCSKKYKDICTGDVVVSIRNPDSPHLYIRFCGACYLKWGEKNGR